MIRIPSHSLQTRLMKISGPFGELYNMVVAVPTKNTLAFSSSVPAGWTLVSFALGRDVGCCAWPRVGGSSFRGSRDRCFMMKESQCVEVCVVNTKR